MPCKSVVYTCNVLSVPDCDVCLFFAMNLAVTASAAVMRVCLFRVEGASGQTKRTEKVALFTVSNWADHET